MQTIALGVVLRAKPGATRWAKQVWRAIAVMPGAPEASWRLLRDEHGVREYHAATLELALHRGEVEAYRAAMSMTPPSVFVVLRASVDGPFDLAPHAVTASVHEAQDYQDSGEELVEPVAAPTGLVAWIEAFVAESAAEKPFEKRKRDKKRIDLAEDGIGDPRVRQTADVYRAPGSLRGRR